MAAQSFLDVYSGAQDHTVIQGVIAAGVALAVISFASWAVMSVGSFFLNKWNAEDDAEHQRLMDTYRSTLRGDRGHTDYNDGDGSGSSDSEHDTEDDAPNDNPVLDYVVHELSSSHDSDSDSQSSNDSPSSDAFAGGGGDFGGGGASGDW